MFKISLRVALPFSKLASRSVTDRKTLLPDRYKSNNMQEPTTNAIGLQIKGGRMSHTVDPRNALLQVFSSINPEETLINLSDGVSHSSSQISAIC